MPALLDHLNFDATSKKNEMVQPLLIELSPYGMFSRLVAFILKSEDCALLKKLKVPECLHRNCVSFKYKKLPAVFTIVESTFFIEVHIDPGGQYVPFIEVHIDPGGHCKACPKIRNLVRKGIKKCAEVLKYSGCADPIDGFVCSTCRFIAIPYELCTDKASCSHCSNDMELGPEHTVWIKGEEIHDDGKEYLYI